MEFKLEDRTRICIGHIRSRNKNCQYCRMDDYNTCCPDYLSQIQAIKTYRPEQTPSPSKTFFIDNLT